VHREHGAAGVYQLVKQLDPAALRAVAGVAILKLAEVGWDPSTPAE
jgi:hypothetical protein